MNPFEGGFEETGSPTRTTCSPFPMPSSPHISPIYSYSSIAKLKLLHDVGALVAQGDTR